MTCSVNNPIGYWKGSLLDILKLDPPNLKWMKRIINIQRESQYRDGEIGSELLPMYFTFVMNFESHLWEPICCNCSNNLHQEDEFYYDQSLNCEIWSLMSKILGMKMCDPNHLLTLDLTKTDAEEDPRHANTNNSWDGPSCKHRAQIKRKI